MRNILTFLVLLFPFFFNKEQRNTEYLLFIFSVNRKKSHFHQADMLLFLLLLHWTTLNSSWERRLKEKQGENLMQLKSKKFGGIWFES